MNLAQGNCRRKWFRILRLKFQILLIDVRVVLVRLNCSHHWTLLRAVAAERAFQRTVHLLFILVLSSNYFIIQNSDCKCVNYVVIKTKLSLEASLAAAGSAVRQCTYKFRVRRVHITTVAVVKQ